MLEDGNLSDSSAKSGLSDEEGEREDDDDDEEEKKDKKVSEG